MKFKHFIYSSKYLKKEGEVSEELKEYTGSYEGYFQDHAVGQVLCDKEVKQLFQIGL